jgi:hypothetical protein
MAAVLYFETSRFLRKLSYRGFLFFNKSHKGDCQQVIIKKLNTINKGLIA